MSLADEIAKLDSLRQAGVLSEDEFQKAKTRLLTGESPNPSETQSDGGFKLRWCKKKEGAFIAGVCTGIASATASPTWFWRLVFFIAACAPQHYWEPACSFSLIVYIFLALFMPKE